ncbi:MAG: nicotinate (nicotinamide) nucleotide adenylyltransferase [Verrucomicrobiota bacterium]
MAAPTRKRAAIFGGSFDPVHLGHLKMLRVVSKELAFDKIVVMPCFVSPFKSSTVATSEQRVEMLEQGIADMGLEGVTVSRFEIERERPSYSWETAEHFTQLEPEVEWHWILGTDQWSAIEKWAEPEKLRKLLRFVILTRDGDDVMPRDQWEYREIPFSHPASSTAIRNNFSAHADWLTSSVLSFCEAKGLYGS